MFKRLFLAAGLALAAVSAQATVLSSTLAYSTYTTPWSSSNTAADYYAGDAATTGEIARLYDVFALPTYQAGYAVQSAVFSIQVSSRWNDAANPLGLYAVDADPASATGWFAKPALGTLLSTFNPSQNQATYTFDVTGFVNAQYRGDGKATLALAGLTEGAGKNSWTYLTSGSGKLNVQTARVATVPEPGSLALVGIACAALGALRRKRRAA